MNKVTIALIVIAALLIVGASSAGTRALKALDNVISSSRNNGIEPVTTPYFASFGGYTIMRHVYTTDKSFSTKEGYQALDSMITQLNANSTVSASSNGVTFDLVSVDNDTSSFYVRFLTAEDTTGAKEVKVSDYDYFTVDFDISGVSVSNFKVYLLFRDTGGKALGANDNYVTITGNSVCADEKSRSAEDIVHVTLAYKFNADDGYTVCNVFFDGDYATSFVNPSSTPVANLDYIEGLAIGDGQVLNENTFTVNNVVFNGFLNGYEGAVENMFNYPYTPLERNSDSILFDS